VATAMGAEAEAVVAGSLVAGVAAALIVVVVAAAALVAGDGRPGAPGLEPPGILRSWEKVLNCCFCELRDSGSAGTDMRSVLLKVVCPVGEAAGWPRSGAPAAAVAAPPSAATAAVPAAAAEVLVDADVVVTALAPEVGVLGVCTAAPVVGSAPGAVAARDQDVDGVDGVPPRTAGEGEDAGPGEGLPPGAEPTEPSLLLRCSGTAGEPGAGRQRAASLPLPPGVVLATAPLPPPPAAPPRRPLLVRATAEYNSSSVCPLPTSPSSRENALVPLRSPRSSSVAMRRASAICAGVRADLSSVVVYSSSR